MLIKIQNKEIEIKVIPIKKYPVLLEQLKTLPKIKAVRGIGLMIGIEMENIAAPLRKQLLFEQHVFTGASGTNVIRLLPPLCLSKTEADIFISRFKQILK